jgi:mRNA-degrading endonuclease toxin of MazEF toxin-antitoxin module
MKDDSDVAKRLRERAARVTGPAPRVVRQGEVWAVNDELVVLPEERTSLKPRTLHPERFVIVVQDSDSLLLPRQRTVSVVPCSTSYAPGEMDIELESPSGFSQRSVAAFVSLVQPMLIDDLARRGGTLDPENLMKLGAALLQLWSLSAFAELLSPEGIAG